MSMKSTWTSFLTGVSATCAALAVLLPAHLTELVFAALGAGGTAFLGAMTRSWRATSEAYAEEAVVRPTPVPRTSQLYNLEMWGYISARERKRLIEWLAEQSDRSTCPCSRAVVSAAVTALLVGDEPPEER